MKSYFSKESEFIDLWSVDYGDRRASKSIQVPHAWNQDVPIDFEGPVTYSAEIAAPVGGSWLIFHGISYAANISLDGVAVARHEGIWDAFSIQLPIDGGICNIQVEVIKNGGQTYPCNKVLSGFIPSLYQSFGGIFRPVELVSALQDPLLKLQSVREKRISLNRKSLLIDGDPFFLRAILHWGWYPHLGHPNPPEATIRKEIKSLKQLGFNTVKFAMWLPPHAYLSILEKEGMFAWIELPWWLPSQDIDSYDPWLEETERIVRQYRKHSCIIAWTAGCELGDSVPYEIRKKLFELISSLTGSPLVRDSSGGAEMFGGDPRESATFYDFHVYCDLPFLPDILDQLIPGSRHEQPTLLGEFSDFDTHRDLPKLYEEHPPWASTLPEYNARGVRSRCNLPTVLSTSRFVHEPRENSHESLMARAAEKSSFIRKFAHETVRAREEIGGYVVNSMRDTPITGSGVFDDWEQSRISIEEAAIWNSESIAFLIPCRIGALLNGSFRMGYKDPFNVALGPNLWSGGIHSERRLFGVGEFSLHKNGETIAKQAINPIELEALSSYEVGKLFVDIKSAGTYSLEFQFADVRNQWKIEAFDINAPLGVGQEAYPLFVGPDCLNLVTHLGVASLRGQLLPEGDLPASGLVVLSATGTLAMPFWRCGIAEYPTALCHDIGIADNWTRLLAATPESVIEPHWLQKMSHGRKVITHMRRIDTRSYEEHDLLVELEGGLFITTLRPFGGIGSFASGLKNNPSGIDWTKSLIRRSLAGSNIS